MSVWGSPEIRGTFLGVLGSILGSPHFGKYHISTGSYLRLSLSIEQVFARENL